MPASLITKAVTIPAPTILTIALMIFNPMADNR